MANSCHFCHETFMPYEDKYKLKVENYVTLVARSLGIEREDKLKLYKQIQDVEKVLQAAHEIIQQSPYSPERIREVLEGIL